MRTRLAGALALVGLVVACSSSPPRITTFSYSPNTATSAAGRTRVPHFAHIVVVWEENHGYQQIVGSRDAPYLKSLISAGTLLTRSYGVAHPSEPNYLALFSGSTHGISDDTCPLSFSGPDLASVLAARGKSFVGYAEGLPRSGSHACRDDAYARKHAPWVNFADVPVAVSQPMVAFPTSFAALPSVAFVVPNLDHDMHDGTVAEADQWLRLHLDAYARWAPAHNSLLVVTFDEDDSSENNLITTVLVGAHVKRGNVDAEQVDHYSVLRTLEDAFGTAYLGTSAHRQPIGKAWAT